MSANREHTHTLIIIGNHQLYGKVKKILVNSEFETLEPGLPKVPRQCKEITPWELSVRQRTGEPPTLVRITRKAVYVTTGSTATKT